MRLEHGWGRRARLVVAVSGLLGCAVDVAQPSADRVEQGLSAVTTETFETRPLGALGSPWSVTPTPPSSGTSTVSVVSTSDHGKVALLHGGTASDFIIASLAASSSDPVMHAELAINPAAGASFVFALQGAGSSIGSRRIRLQRSPGSSMLTAQTNDFGTHDCGVLPSGVWSTIALDVRADAHTFDVSINGVASATCTGGNTQIGVPFTGISFMDASNEGWGGDVMFDDFALTGDAAPPCTPPATSDVTALALSFDGDPLGNLAAPWSVSQSSAKLSTARVVSATGHGRALQLHGSTRSGELVIADRPFDAAADQTDVRWDFAIRPSSGASFVLALNGAGGSIGARRIRLQRAPGSTTLVADTAGSSNRSCGTLASSTWSTVSLTVHTQGAPHTFDVLINGAATSCTAAPTELGTPFTSVNAMDASNSGWGGDVLLDDFKVTASGAPAGSCP